MAMRFELEEYHRNVSDDELISDLKRVASKMGKNSVTTYEQNEIGKFHSTTFTRRFGSRFAALERAGLQKTRTPMNLSNEELFLNLEEIWIKLGRQPRYAEVQKPLSKYSAATYENHFGTWRKALGKFTTSVNSEENAPLEEEINNSIGEAARKHKTSRKINWRLCFIVMRRDSFRCKNCGRSPATDPSIILHVDHIKAWANEGETVLENLQTLCSKCNIGKSDLD
jgi:hypothetical protein